MSRTGHGGRALRRCGIVHLGRVSTRDRAPVVRVRPAAPEVRGRWPQVRSPTPPRLRPVHWHSAGGNDTRLHETMAAWESRRATGGPGLLCEGEPRCCVPCAAGSLRPLSWCARTREHRRRGWKAIDTVSADIQGCGKNVTLSGTLVSNKNQRPLPGGGSLITFSNHFLPNSVVVTSSSGAAYRFVSVEHTTVVAMPSGGFTVSALQRLKFIGQGDAPTLHVRFTLHVTVVPTASWPWPMRHPARSVDKVMASTAC